eukprot:6853957-Lingulodinium_polyedra.AAC.1
MDLLSDWLRALSHNPCLEYEFDALFGISKLGAFWAARSSTNPKLKDHPTTRRKGYPKKQCQ